MRRMLMPIVLVGTLAVVQNASGMFHPRPGWTKALLETGEQSVSEEFAAEIGAELLQQYQISALFYVPDARLPEFARAAQARQIGFAAVPRYDMVETAGMLIDTRIGIPPEIAPDERITEYPSGTKGLYLLQYMGPMLQEWQTQVTHLGIDQVQYINNNAMIVAATPEEIERAFDLPFVQWIDFFHPFLKAFGPEVRPPGPHCWFWVSLPITTGWESAIEEIRDFAVSVSPPQRHLTIDVTVVVSAERIPMLKRHRLVMWAEGGYASWPDPIPTLSWSWLFALALTLSVAAMVAIRR